MINPYIVEQYTKVNYTSLENPHKLRFSNIILCVKHSNLPYFDCKKFESYKEANDYLNNVYTTNINHSTMIQLSKMWPVFIEKQIIQYKLNNLFNIAKFDY